MLLIRNRRSKALQMMIGEESLVQQPLKWLKPSSAMDDGEEKQNAMMHFQLVFSVSKQLLMMLR